MSLSFLIILLFCQRLSISWNHDTLKDVESNVARGIARKSISRSDAATSSTSIPNCDWVILEFDPQSKEAIGVCWDLSDVSFRFDYDSNTNQMILKQFDNEGCSGSYNEFFEPQTVIETNLNTGFLCETFAWTAAGFGTYFDGTGTKLAVEAKENLNNGLPNNCNAFFSDIFWKVLQCDTTTKTIKWQWYEDDECENVIPADSYFPQYFNHPQLFPCDLANYTETFGIGDINLMVEISEVLYGEEHVDDIVCTERRKKKPCNIYNDKAHAALMPNQIGDE